LGEFRSADGTRIAFSDEGEGRPLVLLHGLMANRRFFDRQRPLAERFRLIRVDLRGHGESPAGAVPPTIDTLADDVTALAEHLELEGAVGIGWSLGAAVLWRLLAGPGSPRFAGSIVVDMTPRVLNDEGWTLGLPRETCDARSAAIADDFPAFAAAAGQAIFAAPCADAEWASKEFARNDASAIGALWASLVEADFRPSLAQIRQPTLVIHGAHSHLYDAGTAGHLVAELPTAAAIRFEESGHAPHIEQAELFNATISDFAALLPPIPTAHATV
jgi:pimeloyl-ACP methyl ester carboxylesterase